VRYCKGLAQLGVTFMHYRRRVGSVGSLVCVTVTDWPSWGSLSCITGAGLDQLVPLCVLLQGIGPAGGHFHALQPQGWICWFTCVRSRFGSSAWGALSCATGAGLDQLVPLCVTGLAYLVYLCVVQAQGLLSW
jgi:hypothetical protein